jgi:hypothetical protein
MAGLAGPAGLRGPEAPVVTAVAGGRCPSQILIKGRAGSIRRAH